MKLIKTIAPQIDRALLPDYDVVNNIISMVYNDLNSQLETAVINGLKLKGFEFNTRYELEKFVKNHCRCEDNINLEERIYYVNEKPFLKRFYKTEIGNISRLGDRETILSANLGYFIYL